MQALFNTVLYNYFKYIVGPPSSTIGPSNGPPPSSSYPLGYCEPEEITISVFEPSAYTFVDTV